MDLAVDITSAVWEVIGKKPDISARKPFCRDSRVGRAARVLMTTRPGLPVSILRRVYFIINGVHGPGEPPVDHILNYKYVAAEGLDTVVEEASGWLQSPPLPPSWRDCFLPDGKSGGCGTTNGKPQIDQAAYHIGIPNRERSCFTIWKVFRKKTCSIVL